MKPFSIIYALLLISVISCKNTPDQSPEDLAIQNTNSGKVLLRFKPQVGDEMDMMMNALVDTKGENKLNVDMGVNFHLRAKGIEDSTYTYTMDIQKITMDTNIDGFSVKYDSSKDNEGFAAIINEQMKSILGNKFTFQMSDRAQIKSIAWKDQNLDVPVDKENFNNMSIPLPEKPVGVGDSWTKEININNEGKHNIIFTVKSITANEVVISLNNKNTGPNQPSITGEYVLDRKTSFTKTGEINVKMKSIEQPTTMKILFKAL